MVDNNSNATTDDSVTYSPKNKKEFVVEDDSDAAMGEEVAIVSPLAKNGEAKLT